MRRVCLIALVLSAIVLGCSAEQSDAERARSIEGQVWSPYCPGRLLIDCTTTQARELRDEIRDRVERGDDTGDVIAWIRGEYGEGAVARPAGSGGGLVIWLVPAAIFLAGGLVVLRLVRRSRTTADSLGTSSSP